ncbi:type III effector [Vibrio cidicii]|uniref:HopJ type III effector protein n=2 Tax=Vibrio TaxID=662 RepID=A0AAI9CQY4_9VIBR|nr:MULTISPECIES: HopJ type III effector protein [Vibrio]EHA1124148.1 HopJ type III effector protein [Vibrio navarrensis]EJL6398290.1 HopJ type III effector protein [Vibrio navarrensis]EJL6566656.1 HopJ type III effector protein [Vibrio navarrensis]EJN6828320.1 HopJ type III effector protein [Vibrio cidicii]ELN6930765.1 HopJ type III effector protein [Vibrio navarrensis]
MTLNALLEKLQSAPNSVEFDHVIEVIDANYHFTPSAFRNGECENQVGQNNGSCKIFSFAQLHGLSVPQTLACFGRFYREDVLQYPDNLDHQNIRNFMRFGWKEVVFESQALSAK